MYAAGDVATRDADGYFRVMGRADDVLNVSGYRIGTADVESALVSVIRRSPKRQLWVSRTI